MLTHPIAMRSHPLPARTWIGLLAVLLLASGLVLIGTQEVSLWEDESWMAVDLEGDLGHVWQFATERGVHPPLYFVLGWLYTRFTGDSEIALRWLSGLCAVLGVALTYRLSADWFGRRAALYAALLSTGSIFLIYFGRLARHYTLFFALAAALVWAYNRWHRQLPPTWRRFPSSEGRTEGQGRAWFLAVAFLQAGLLYTHYFGAWMAVVVGLHGLFTLRWRGLWRLGGALALGGILFVPWLPSLWVQIQHGGEGLGYAIHAVDFAVRAYLDRVFNGDYLFGFVLALLGAAAIWRGRKNRAGLLLLLWLTIPLGLSLLINTRFAWFIERNMIFTLAGVYSLFGAGLAWVGRYRLGRLIAPVAAGLFVVLGLVRYPDFWPYITPDWRGLARGMAVEARPGDLFVLRGEPYSLTYYLRRELNTPVPIVPLETWLAQPSPMERTWLIDAGWAVRFEALDALPPDAMQTRRYVLGVLVAELYQRIPAGPRATFGGQLALGCYELPPVLEARPGETLDLDFWWQALRPPDADYSVGLYLLAPDDRMIAQQDGGFDRARVPTAQLPADGWIPDARALVIPPDTPAGTYTLAVAVYDWRTGERLPPAAGARADQAFILGEVHIQSRDA